MKKISILLYLFIGGTLLVKAQNAEMALAQINYSFTHINDTLNKDMPHKEETVLYLGEKLNKYTSYESTKMQKNMAETINSANFDGNLTLTSGDVSDGTFYYGHENQKFTGVYSLVSQNYEIEEDLPVIQWEILDETKKIGDFSAQKAEGYFRGRTYEAWFTTDLPFSGAPWKLLGLPGVVLEATDKKGHVQFKFLGFEVLKDEKINISLPANLVKTNKKEYDNVKAAIAKNPSVATRTVTSASNGTSVMSVGGSSGAPTTTIRMTGSSTQSSAVSIDASKIKSINVNKSSSKSKITNNPIELSDK